MSSAVALHPFASLRHIIPLIDSEKSPELPSMWIFKIADYLIKNFGLPEKHTDGSIKTDVFSCKSTKLLTDPHVIQTFEIALSIIRHLVDSQFPESLCSIKAPEGAKRPNFINLKIRNDPVIRAIIIVIYNSIAKDLTRGEIATQCALLYSADVTLLPKITTIITSNQITKYIDEHFAPYFSNSKEATS